MLIDKYRSNIGGPHKIVWGCVLWHGIGPNICIWEWRHHCTQLTVDQNHRTWIGIGPKYRNDITIALKWSLHWERVQRGLIHLIRMGIGPDASILEWHHHCIKSIFVTTSLIGSNVRASVYTSVYIYICIEFLILWSSIFMQFCMAFFRQTNNDFIWMLLPLICSTS